MSETPSILESLGAARRFADPQGPATARRLAAGGALPLPPAQLASVLVALTSDPDEEVRTRAAESLGRMPDTLVDQVIGAAVHPAVLDWFARASREHEERLIKLALNPDTSDQTFCFLAALPFTRLVELAANNQVRLLRCPALVEVLGENPVAGHATIDRILHFLGVERGAEEEPGIEDPEVEPTPEVAAPDTAFELGDGSDLPPELTEERDPDAKDKDDDASGRSLTAQIQEMSVMQKIKLGIFGNSEARAILIRDRNRIVATSVIRSPKLTENEVASFAKARNLADDVYRIIASNRAWTKSYAIKLALATNTKVPPAAAIKFLNYLTDRDLRMIMRSRDVSGPVATQARRMLAKKGKI